MSCFPGQSSAQVFGALHQDRNILLDNPAGKAKKAHAPNNPAKQLLSGTKLKALGLEHRSAADSK